MTNNIKRFYQNVEAKKNDFGWSVLLDGQSVKSAARRSISLPNESMALALANEWREQGEIIVLASMPVMRFASGATDGTLVNPHSARAEIVNYAGSDLLCYRASHPADLVCRQEQAWGPVLQLFEEKNGWCFRVVAGINFVEQPASIMGAIEKWLENVSDYRLAALHVATVLTGSALLALALDAGWLSAEDAWELGHVDEDYQAEYWGLDAEAISRRAHRYEDYSAAMLSLK